MDNYEKGEGGADWGTLPAITSWAHYTRGRGPQTGVRGGGTQYIYMPAITSWAHYTQNQFRTGVGGGASNNS